MAGSDFKFEIRMKEADSSKLKAMLVGIKEHFDDTTMNFYETKVFVVETKDERVAEILKLLNVSDLTPKKRGYRKVTEPDPSMAENLPDEHSKADESVEK